MTLRPGERIGSYEVVARIGGGSSAEIYEVVHTTLRTRHALKVLQRAWLERADLRRRFLAEGQLQASFRSPHLVRVTDTIAEPGVAALVMDLLQGETLRERLEQVGALPWEEAVRWTIQALTALEEAHGAGVVHRDIKPENLFLDTSQGEERLRVIDFGIAKGPHEHRTTQAGTLGTCAYMSPEQVVDPGAVDRRTDLFAMGAVLWEMLVGRPPFEGTTAFNSMQAVLESEPPAPSSEADVPAWLDAVVARALEKKPDRRWPTAAAFREALEQRAAPSIPPASSRATPARPRGSSWVLPLLLAAFASIALFTVGAAMIGLLVFSYRPPVLHDLQVRSDPCGLTIIEADVDPNGRPVVLRVNGDEVIRQEPEGRTTVRAEVPLPPGSTAEVELTMGKVRESVTHTTHGEPPSIDLAVPPTLREGRLAPLHGQIRGSCLPEKLQVRTVVDDRRSREMLQPGDPLIVHIDDLKEGAHPLRIEVTDPDGRSLATYTTTLVIRAAPPADDQDLDGHSPPEDCDDNDPAVHPDAPEQPLPNGVDDDCDGTVDEGTVAYDDDGDGLSENDGDCDDDDPAVHPGATEQPDCRDQDCDGTIDEGLSLPKRDDAYEPNGSRDRAFDLGTDGARSFRRELRLVLRDRDDEAWFRFFSHDGTWDNWGIDARVLRMPAESALLLEVYDEEGRLRSSAVVEDEGEGLTVEGLGLHNDSGTYRLRVQPRQLLKDWCPALIVLEGR